MLKKCPNCHECWLTPSNRIEWYWMDVDSLTRWPQILTNPKPRKLCSEFWHRLQRFLAIIGIFWRVFLHPKAKWRKHTYHTKGYAKNELKEWSIMMVHVSPDENSVDTLHLEFFILSICNFGLYETCETSKRAYLTYLNPCSWLRASRIASLGAPWGLNQSQTALESQSSLVD